MNSEHHFHLKATLLFTSVLALCSTLSQACRDMGTELPIPPIIATPSAVSLTAGDTSQVTLQGGILPYTISRPPNASVATATISDSLVKVVGVAAGTTDLEVSDNSSPPQQITLQITISAGVAVVSFSSQIQPIFNTNGCVSCHGGSGGLFLTQGQSYNNLVNVNAQAACTTLKRVLAGNASQSVLFIRVSSNTADTQCGPNSRMPQGSPRLPQATIDLIEDWINQGAKNN